MAFMSRATHVLQWPVQRAATSRGEANPEKAGLSPDWSLQLDSMKLESLVIADQHAAVNTFPGLVHTARHTTKVDCSRRRWANLREAGVQGMIGNWGEVVTR
jgi:hypothetical protein